MPVVILAAGRGTRLRPVSNHYSKAMVPVLNRHLLAWVIDSFRDVGFERFIVVAGPDDEPLKAWCAAESGLTVVVQEEALGSGHARNVRPS